MENLYVPDSVNDCFHIYSNGTNVNLLCETRKDYIFIMNMIAASSFACDVKILTDQIMSTHFHAIISGTERNCDIFARRITAILNRFISDKGRSSHINGDLEVSLDPIYDSDELKNKIIYVYRNALSARYPLMPWKYEWGPGDIYFVDHSELENIGRPLSELSLYRQRLTFHTHVNLPQWWRMNDEGMILPHCYFDWKRVEDIFGSSYVFISFIHQKKNQKLELEACFKHKLVQQVTETELREYAKKLFRDMFGRIRISIATVPEKIAVARKLCQDHRIYSVSMLSRVVLLSQEILDNVLNK